MSYEIKFTSQFEKDLKLAQRQHRDLDKLFETVKILASNSSLDASYSDHSLEGKYKGTRECHIEPDWLLIYEIDKKILSLVLYRLGTHSELFKR